MKRHAAYSEISAWTAPKTKHPQHGTYRSNRANRVHPILEFVNEFARLFRSIRPIASSVPSPGRLALPLSTAGWTLLALALIMVTRRPEDAPPILPTPVASLPDNIGNPVRPMPARFPPGSHLPRMPEKLVSGPIRLESFSPQYDLIRLEDSRIWWESDHDSNDVEDDHIIHRSLREPLERLAELVTRRGGRLKVQDAYRPVGVHSSGSLHKEGRAVDLTCDGISLEELARLCWAAGFDWVYYETPRRGGAHVHCSVRR